MVTREALRIAHEKCQFIGTVDRQYDDSYAKTGAKIGSPCACASRTSTPAPRARA
jgi:hypothetical protein